MVNIPCLQLPPTPLPATEETMVSGSFSPSSPAPSICAMKDIHGSSEYRSFRRNLRDTSGSVLLLVFCAAILKCTSNGYTWIGGDSTSSSMTIDDALVIASCILFVLAFLPCPRCAIFPFREVFVEDALCLTLTLSNCFILFSKYCERVAVESVVGVGEETLVTKESDSIQSPQSSFYQMILCCVSPLLAQLLLRSISDKVVILSWGLIAPCTVLGIAAGEWGVIQSLWVLLIATMSFWGTWEYEKAMSAAFAMDNAHRNLCDRWESLEEQNDRVENKIKVMQEKYNDLLVEVSRAKSSVEAERKRVTGMMGNVAHDLKTPLQSIRMDADVLKSKLVGQLLCGDNKNGEANCFVECTEIIDGFAGTCSFMSMAINRCLDYTKSQYGVGLVPCPETFNLLEAIKVPLKCMRNIQSDIEITLCPIPDGIAAHIISDKHWLCENILCYLSNSVKYSAGGQVEVIVTLESRPRRAPLVNQTRPGINHGAAAVRTPRNPSGHVLSRTNSSNGMLNGRVGGSGVGINGRVGVAAAMSAFGQGQSSPRSGNGVGSAEGKFVCVTVRDCGIGVPEDKRERLFQPFSQMQSLAGGTGLGLYSLALRIEALGGNYGCDPRRDGKQGSEFWFAFPYRPDFSNEIETSRSPRRSLGEPLKYIKSPLMSPQKGMPQSPYTHHSARDAMDKVKSPMPRLRILVVDDSPAVLKVVGRALTNEGHEVKTAKNGYVGLTMMKESLVAGSLDMVIIDMQMPVMDGLETVTRFREHEAKQKYEVYMSIATTTTATTSECTADAESISPLLSTVDTEGLSGRSTGNGNGISTFSLDDLVGENSQEFDSPSKISVRSASSTSSASSWEEPSDRRIMALDVETSVTKSPPLGTSMREHSDAAYTNHYMHTHSNGRVMSENLHCGMISSPKRPKALLGCMAAHEGPGAAYSTEDDSDNASTSNKVNGGHLSPRQHERSCTEDLFIVGMSANNDFETQEMALKAGMDAFIVKPFSFNDLEVVLKARMFH